MPGSDAGEQPTTSSGRVDGTDVPGRSRFPSVQTAATGGGNFSAKDNSSSASSSNISEQIEVDPPREYSEVAHDMTARSVDPAFEMLHTVGSWGKFQKQLLFLVSGLLWLVAGSHTALLLFTNREPPRVESCATSHLENLHCDPSRVLEPSDCRTPFEYAALKSYSTVTDFNLDPQSCKLTAFGGATWSTSVYFFGVFIGALFCAPTADRIGRKPVLVFCWALLQFAAFLGIISWSYSLFTLSKFLVGMGLSGATLVGYTLMSEFTTSAHRNTTAASMSFLFCMGAALTCVIGSFMPPWRTLSSVPLLLGFGLTPAIVLSSNILLESPRWLVARRRPYEAYEIWLQVAETNERLVPESLSPAKYAMLEMGSALTGAHDSPFNKKLPLTSDELDFLHIGSFAGRKDTLGLLLTRTPLGAWVLACILLWLSASFGYYGIMLDMGNVARAVELAHGFQSVPPTPPLMAETEVHARILQGIPQQGRSPGMIPMPMGLIEQPPTPKPFPVYPLPVSDKPSRWGSKVPGEVPSQSPLEKDEEQELEEAGAGEIIKVGHPGLPSRMSERLSKRHDAQENLEWQHVLDAIAKGTYWDGFHNVSSEARKKAIDLADLIRRIEPNHLLYSEDLAPAHTAASQHFKSETRTLGTACAASFVTEAFVAYGALTMASKPTIGRRKVIIGGLGSSAIMCLIGFVLTRALFSLFPSTEMEWVLLGVATLSRLGASMALTTLYLVTSELFPSSVRSGVLGLCSAAARVSASFASPAIAISENLLPGSSFFFFFLSLGVSAIMGSLYLPETLGLPMMDSISAAQADIVRRGYFIRDESKKITRWRCVAVSLFFGPILSLCLLARSRRFQIFLLLADPNEVEEHVVCELAGDNTAANQKGLEDLDNTKNGKSLATPDIVSKVTQGAMMRAKFVTRKLQKVLVHGRSKTPSPNVEMAASRVMMGADSAEVVQIGVIN